MPCGSLARLIEYHLARGHSLAWILLNIYGFIDRISCEEPVIKHRIIRHQIGSSILLRGQQEIPSHGVIIAVDVRLVFIILISIRPIILVSLKSSNQIVNIISHVPVLFVVSAFIILQFCIILDASCSNHCYDHVDQILVITFLA